MAGQAGIQFLLLMLFAKKTRSKWIPAFAGMTTLRLDY